MQNNRTEIPITQIPGISIGQVEDPEAATGCTVLVMTDSTDHEFANDGTNPTVKGYIGGESASVYRPCAASLR